MDKKTHFRQAIQVPQQLSVTVFALPVVSGVHKSGEDGSPIYHLFGNSLAEEERHDDDKVNPNKFCFAHPGEWLCEDVDGKWHVLSQKDYEARQTA